MIFNDHINFFPDVEIDIEKQLIDSFDSPIKIKYAVVTKEFDTSIILKYYPDIKIKYLSDPNINEIGITHFISDYFLSHQNKKLIDNFVIFMV